jgi:ATP citrate (pro-S)-lyase
MCVLFVPRACSCFKKACEDGLGAAAFVEGLKKQGKRVPGIGHRIKSKDNRDKRVELLSKYARRVSARQA